MWYIVLAARIFVGTLLLISGAGKLANRSEFFQIVAAYKLVPKSALPAFSYALPAAEIITGVTVLFGLFTPVPAYAACFLFFIFILAMAINMFRGANDTPCGCFAGRLEKISWVLVVRNLMLSALALLSVGKGFSIAFIMVIVYVLIRILRSLGLAFAPTQASTS